MAENSGRFVKGDKRINRKGRPKDFLQLRALAQQIANEILELPEGDQKTVVENILRKLAEENPERFLEIAYGKVPTPMEHEISGEVPLMIVIDR